MIKDEKSLPNESSAVDALFWRDEILQLMYWLIGESLMAEPTAADVQRFLNEELNLIQFHLDAAVADGYLECHPDSAGMASGRRYSLSDLGRIEGARRFADEFADMTKPAHGECSADCDCHKTGKANCSHLH